MNIRDIWKKARGDPPLEVECIVETNWEQVERALQNVPENAIVSEWRYDFIKIHYVYNIHNDGLINELRDLYNKGIRGGNPELTNLYSRTELEEIVAKGKLKYGQRS